MRLSAAAGNGMVWGAAQGKLLADVAAASFISSNSSPAPEVHSGLVCRDATKLFDATSAELAAVP